MILVVMGFAGMAVDTGYLEWQRRLMQSAADAGAMGALREMELGRTNTQPQFDLTTAAQNDTAMNGFSNGVHNISVTLNNPPVSGPFQGVSTAAQVIITEPYPTFFMRVLGMNSVTVSAQAVAQTTTSYGSIGGCIYALSALNTSDNGALTVSGGTTTVSTSCSAVDESSGTQAFEITGGATWNFTSHNAHIGVVGQWTNSGHIWDTTLSPEVAENPVTITSPGDPLINIATPTTSNVAVTTIQATGASYDSGHMPSGGQLNPGVYCSGITINSGTITLNPGVYVLAGGGLTVSSNAVLTGSGVMFYNTTGEWGSICPTTNYPIKPMTVSGGGTTKISAPTSGTWVGMLFYEDRSLSNENNAISGNSTATFDGAIYFKQSKLTFSGNNSSNGYMLVVADTITISGASTLGNNYTSLSDPNPSPRGRPAAGWSIKTPSAVAIRR